ncbi:YfhL family 4Fe-4S dicluster ferredoxin [Caenispirillum bisanense]|uniref:YfhL family 4Fe-4S dicluster ferredoxin n=1 Tax=Caenispirillum bisanense TaxID=414052 RepID=UPI0031D55DB3
MAMLITDDCTACAACETVCPNAAISMGDIYFHIDPGRCTECVGAHDSPECVAVCPADCIHEDPAHLETQGELRAKYEALHA